MQVLTNSLTKSFVVSNILTCQSRGKLNQILKIMSLGMYKKPDGRSFKTMHSDGLRCFKPFLLDVL